MKLSIRLILSTVFFILITTTAIFCYEGSNPNIGPSKGSKFEADINNQLSSIISGEAENA